MLDQTEEPAASARRLQARKPPAILLAWLLVAVWAGVIFALSATPHLRVAEASDLDFILRKSGHMAAFGILAVLIWRALGLSGVRRAMVLSLVLTIAYAASDEFHQSFTAGRNPSSVDVSIDSVGAVIALTALVIWLRWRSRVRTRRPAD